MTARWASAVLLSVLLALTACGGGGGGGGTPPAATAPTISTPPASVTVQVGQTASFSVTVSGTAPLTYQWRRNGVAITGATLSTYTTAATVVGDDGAVFSVVVSNSTGSATSADATLTVTPVPPPAAADRIANWGRQADGVANQNFLHVVDPTQPALASTLSIDLNVVAPRARVAAAGGGVTLGMAPFAYTTAQGRVYQIDLRASGSGTAERISSVTNACYVGMGMPLVADATQSLVVVTTSGPDGNCNAVADNTLAFVRTGMDTTTAALTLPTGVAPPLNSHPLQNPATLATEGLLMIDSRSGVGQLMVYSPSLQPIGAVAGGANVTRVNMLNGDGGNTQAQHYNVDGALRRLTWTGTTATLSASQHTFATPNPAFAFGAVGSDGTYFMDGFTLLRVQGAATAAPLATLTSGGAVDAIFLTDGHVVLHQTTTLYAGSITAVPRAGGAPVTLVANAAAGSARLVGTRNDTLLYLVEGSATALQDLREITVSTGTNRLVDSGLQLAGAVWSRDMPAGSLYDPIAGISSMALSGAVYCKPIAPTPNCAISSVHRYDLASTAITGIGALNHVLTINSSFKLTIDTFGLYAGLPGTLNALFSGRGPNASGVEVTGIWSDPYLLSADPLAPVVRISRHGP